MTYKLPKLPIVGISRNNFVVKLESDHLSIIKEIIDNYKNDIINKNNDDSISIIETPIRSECDFMIGNKSINKYYLCIKNEQSSIYTNELSNNKLVLDFESIKELITQKYNTQPTKSQIFLSEVVSENINITASICCTHKKYYGKLIIFTKIISASIDLN